MNFAKNSISMKILYKSGQNHVSWIDLDTETSLERFLGHLSKKWGQQKLVQLGALIVITF